MSGMSAKPTKMRSWFQSRLNAASMMLETLGLATVRKVAPRLKFNRAKLRADPETLQSVITHRYAVLTSYVRSLKQAYALEVDRQRVDDVRGRRSGHGGPI
jgi:hypothetical protein